MEMVIRHPQPEDRTEWIRMRAALWPETSAECHAEEITAFLTGNLTGWLAGLHAVAVFVAIRPAGGLCGFVESSVRPMADGCSTHPVGYLEGWYVDPDARQKGVGRALVKAVEEWASCQGCREMASDAYQVNSVSIVAHKALGFDEEAPSVRFRKWLPAAGVQERTRSKPVHKLTLVALEGTYAVCRLAADAPLPAWIADGPFFSITYTPDELSVICQEEAVPKGMRCEKGWRCLRVAGTLDFSVVGVLASLLDPLAAAGVAVFVVSTFGTDYLLVKQADVERVAEALWGAGHDVGRTEAAPNSNGRNKWSRGGSTP
jgi:GNAT superfamily N-acetyltransferase